MHTGPKEIRGWEMTVPAKVETVTRFVKTCFNYAALREVSTDFWVVFPTHCPKLDSSY